MGKKRVICCGFSPCIQRTLIFSLFKKEQVNRAKEVSVGIGGKGANVARIITQLGGDALLLGFAGGENGRRLEKMLTQEKVPFLHIPVSGETRICQTLVEEGSSETTELVEEMPAVLECEWTDFLTTFSSMDLSDCIVAISGKLPAGLPVDAYAQLAARVHQAGGRVLLDAPGEPLELALKTDPFLVKINQEELFQTTGESDWILASEKLIESGAQSVLITRGAQSVLWTDGTQTQIFTPPSIQAVNPVGSGDAVTAGIALELQRGNSLREAILTGLACGAANALNLSAGVVFADDVSRLREENNEFNSF